VLDGVEFVPVKVRDGDDASCFNLYRAQTPPLLGVAPEAFIRRKAFMREGESAHPWDLLRAEPGSDVVPALAGDSNTALWGLEKKADPRTGDIIMYRDERGNAFKVKLVGTLPMRLSVFQGSLLISAEAFAERFPSEDGYRIFLIAAPWDRAAAVRESLAARLSRVGMDIVPSAERLAEFYSVESAYLAMFLALGGLGLVLGSVGAGVVVLRNVLERRGEMALLRAVGFSRAALSRMLMVEHGFLFGSGVALGTVSAAIAVLPSLAAPGVRAPYGFLALILGAVILAGAVSVALSALAAVRGNLLAALRNE
jgi:hypothetical protein